MKTTMVLPDNTQGRQPEPAAATSYPTPLPLQPKKSWLTPPEEWQLGEGLLDKNFLYSFTLPMTVANTPHNSQQEMSGMDIRDVRLVQVIHGGISNTQTVCTRKICHVGRVSYTYRGPAFKYLLKAPAPTPATQLAHFGKGPCRFDGPQH